ncbi:RcnB family protein [Pantoea anthophila]|uniref:RcnB family protein n=1 Tax=Pantoea anthophila TaxID=470931 RepID=UPI00289D433E|nr:RcnB family protein [Pantoea anthophila]
MRRTQRVLLSMGLLVGSLSLIPAVQAAGEATDSVPPPPQIQPANPDAQPQSGAGSAQPDNGAAQSQAPTTPTTPSTANSARPNYDLSTIIIDYKQYNIGDTVPEKYTDKTYTIVEWQKRNLPAPQENTHWAYINANYILITNDTGKIVMGKSGDIFFRG